MPVTGDSGPPVKFRGVADKDLIGGQAFSNSTGGQPWSDQGIL